MQREGITAEGDKITSFCYLGDTNDIRITVTKIDDHSFVESPISLIRISNNKPSNTKNYLLERVKRRKESENWNYWCYWSGG